MSRRGMRLVFAAAVAAVVAAAVAVERMTTASAQVGMRRAPARRVPRPAVAPARTLVTVKAGQGAAADSTGGGEQEPTRAAPALLSRSTLRRLVAAEPEGLWLDLCPRRPRVPGRGHIDWSGPTRIVTTAERVRTGYAILLRWPSASRSDMRIYVRPQAPGARYLVDCSVQAEGLLAVQTRTAKHMISAVNDHLLFIWETGARGDLEEGHNYVTISSDDTEWTFYRCQLTFLGVPE